MSDCPQSTSNCSDPAPIGGAAIGSACDPCSILKPEDMFEQFKALQEKVCALETKYNNWHQLLGRTRNRVTTLEDTIKNLPDEDEIVSVGCGGLETASEADALLVCDEGAEKAFVPSGSPEEVVFCGGKVKKVPKGIRFFPLAVKQLVLAQANMANNNAVVALPSYPTEPCGEVWAVFESSGQAFPGPSSSGTNVTVQMNGYLVHLTGFFGDYSGSLSFVRVTSATSTFNVTTSGSGVRSVNVNLIGYMY